MRKQEDNVNHRSRPVEEQVLDLIHHLMHQYRSQQHQVLRDGPFDITPMESKVLGFFGHHPRSTQSDIVRHSGRDKAQLARLIRGLRERGLLEAEVDADDRRNVRLSLTAAGAQTLQTLQRQARHLAGQALAGLDVQQRATLLQLLQHLKRNLDGSEPDAPTA